ncbi:MAG TPA: helix-turn-helix domain-containing protein [Acidimicrobiales bacterium]|nr:helix-turn-helix domain-containing protein [Acidimicrobiales bacterium]
MGGAEAGQLLRDARLRAGLSQVELARRAGITQSVVSAYESGSRQPSLPTLERLVRATGHELDVKVNTASAGAVSGLTPLSQRLTLHSSQVRDIAARHGLTNVRVFGSVVRGEDNPESDIDLLVDVGPGVGLLGLARAQRDLEALLGVPVDLIPATDLKPGVASEALAEARPV